MQHNRTGSGKHRTRRPGKAPGGEAAAVYRATQQRPAPPLFLALLRVPGPRLTPLGGGLLATGLMLVTGGLVRFFLGSAPVVYGAVFLVVSLCCALWVRPADAIAAPIAAPPAFAVGMVAFGEGTGGLPAYLVGAATQLAMEAPWLYGGTLLAAVIALLRHFALLAVRRQPGRRPPASPSRVPEQPPRPADRGEAPWEGRR